jgi:hypothetical protein
VEIYRFVWLVTTATVSLSAVVFDVVTGGLVRMSVLGAALALFAGLLTYAFVEELPDRWAWTRRAMLWSGTAAVGADALVAMWGDIGLAVGVVLVGTSPTLLAQGRRLLLAHQSGRTSGPPEDLSTRDLRRRWEWTTTEVLRADLTVARRLHLVEERRQLLDELQDRDPAHFGAWLLTAVPDRPRDRQRPQLP